MMTLMLKAIKTLHLSRFLYGGLLLLLILMPFHAFLTTWAGSVFGQRALWQAWKEILLLAMALVTGGLLLRDRALRRFILNWRPNQLIVVYAIVHLALGGLLDTPNVALMLSLKYNLTFLLLFILAQIVAYYQKPKILEALVVKIIIVTSTAVAGFGLLQIFVLPPDFLRHFGYGGTTVMPFLPVGGSTEQFRIISTLGGANQLGAFLILSVALIADRLLTQRRWQAGVLLFVLITVEFFTYSRSAALGMALALAVVIGCRISRKTATALAAGSLLLIIGTGVYISRHLESLPAAQVVLLHSTSQEAFTNSSNSIRLAALAAGSEALVSSPLGLGPGSAGPASFYTDRPLIPENYYLQIALEVGILGLALFLGFSVLIARELWRRRTASQLALPLLATFAGIAIVNIFLHGWADSTTALVWWGSAGAVVRGKWKKQKEDEP